MRASKTIADERAVVQKESAAIRASFREESGDSNVRYGRITTSVTVRADNYLQTKQCSQVIIPFHFGRANPFRPDRMSKATRITTLCRQAVRIPWHDAIAGREPGGAHSSYKFIEEVSPKIPGVGIRLIKSVQ